jgi:hypothetical protein
MSRGINTNSSMFQRMNSNALRALAGLGLTLAAGNLALQNENVQRELQDSNSFNALHVAWSPVYDNGNRIANSLFDQPLIQKTQSAIDADKTRLDLQVTTAQNSFFERRALGLQVLVEQFRTELERKNTPALPAPGLQLKDLMPLWHNPVSVDGSFSLKSSRNKALEPGELFIWAEKPEFIRLMRAVYELEKSSSK